MLVTVREPVIRTQCTYNYWSNGTYCKMKYQLLQMFHMYSDNHFYMCAFCFAWIGTKHLSQMDTAISLPYNVFNHMHIFFKFNWLLNQCFHNVELSKFMHHEALPLDTICQAGRWAHMHTVSGADQWSYTPRGVRYTAASKQWGMDGNHLVLS